MRDDFQNFHLKQKMNNSKNNSKQKKIEERKRDLEKHTSRRDEDSFVFDNHNKKRYISRFRNL